MFIEYLLIINIIVVSTYLLYRYVKNTQKPIVISIEGNIGVGKSTLTKIISHLLKYDCEIIYESVELWQTITDSKNNNILQLFYEDKIKWAFTFQMIVGLSNMQNLCNVLKLTKKKYIFLDRSFMTSKYTFEKMLYDNGTINTIQHTAYNMLCKHYESTIMEEYKHLYIYLKCDPVVSLERIKKRNRSEESNITLEYLEELNKYHDNWLLKKDNVLVIDCNNDTIDNINWYKNILNNLNIKI
jgi:deoxyadenosine/deoxycytidine kinase